MKITKTITFLLCFYALTCVAQQSKVNAKASYRNGISVHQTDTASHSSVVLDSSDDNTITVTQTPKTETNEKGQHNSYWIEDTNNLLAAVLSCIALAGLGWKVYKKFKNKNGNR